MHLYYKALREQAVKDLYMGVHILLAKLCFCVYLLEFVCECAHLQHAFLVSASTQVKSDMDQHSSQVSQPDHLCKVTSKRFV